MTPKIRITCFFAMLAALALGAGAADSPSCEIVSGGPGGPAILIDHQTFAPMFLAVNNQFNRDEVLLEEIRHAAGAGIRLISFNLGLEWHQSPEAAAAVVAKFCEADPQTYFYLRIWVGPSKTWLDAHPDERMITFDGKTAPMASPGSAAWLEEASAQLARRVEEVVEGPYGHRFIGVMPANFNTGEWFYPDTDNYWDYSPANLNAFRAWLKEKYRRATRLQEAWADHEVTFDTAAIPTPEERESAAMGPFRDLKSHRAAADFTEFTSVSMARAIETMCRAVKKATHDRALAGAFYGYSFELNHNGPRALAHSGHLALGQLLESPYVDLVHAPYAYFQRALGQPGHFHLPLDSIPLHKKLAIMEEDSFTHLGVLTPENELAPGWNQRTTTMDATLALARRNFGQFMMHRSGFWWFDLLSDGRWNSQAFWAQAGFYRRIAAELRDEPLFEPQIAFVVDESSAVGMVDTTHPYLGESLGAWRSELGRLGAPVGYYLQSDLALIPRSVRLLIMANPYRLSKEDTREVERRLDAGVTVLWTFAPGIAGDEGVDLARVTRVTGLDVTVQDSAGPVALETIGTGESWELPETWAMRLRVSGGEPLARYAGTDAVAIARHSSGGGTVVYSAVPRIPVKLLQSLAAQAGVHPYRPGGGMAAVAGIYLFVHAESDDKATLCWPEPKKTAVRLVPGNVAEFSLGEGGCWQDTLAAGSTAVYRLEEAKPSSGSVLDRILEGNE